MCNFTVLKTNYGEPHAQLIVGVVSIVVGKSLSILVDTPAAFYKVFYIDKPFDLSNATLLSFLWTRIAMLIEFIILIVPVFVLVYKLVEQTGENVHLCFLFGTCIVEIVIMVIYPRLIEPLTSSKEPIQEGELKSKIESLCKEVGFKPTKVVSEQGYSGDLHSNASASIDQICINKNLLIGHEDKQERLLAILCHELGHWKKAHLLKSTLIDTFYMIIFGVVLRKVIQEPGFLRNFGFHDESLFVSLVIFVRAWLVSFDLLLRIGLNWWSR